MTEITGILTGVAPDKCLKVLLKNSQGTWYESTMPVGSGIEDKLDEALGHLGHSVKLEVVKGEIEAIGFE